MLCEYITEFGVAEDHPSPSSKLSMGNIEVGVLLALRQLPISLPHTLYPQLFRLALESDLSLQNTMLERI